MPRLATPRLGLSTKGKPVKNPFGANKVTVKEGSLSEGRTLREFLQARQEEKTAGLMVAKGGANAAASVARAQRALPAGLKVPQKATMGPRRLMNVPDALQDMGLPRTATSSSVSVAQPARATAAPPTPPTTVPGTADGILSKTVRYTPMGVAGGLTAYGGLRGWGEGQAEVMRSQQQGFNPQTVY